MSYMESDIIFPCRAAMEAVIIADCTYYSVTAGKYLMHSHFVRKLQKGHPV